jgi:methylenetetrahydrofolate dehydrogenase (NADP+)/methenyltetrahydrofolate cyclohydrolase/formyltetrahydrofolate synthetase
VIALSSSSLAQARYVPATSASDMTATKIDGTGIAKSIRDQLYEEIKARQASNPRFKPSLVIFQGMSFFLTTRISMGTNL